MNLALCAALRCSPDFRSLWTLGVLEAPVASYEVPELTDSGFPLFSEEWLANVA
mgnify:CR=1 FL=1